jgi:hypothetical protein
MNATSGTSWKTLPGSPRGSREEFTAIADGLVADHAPRLFAILQEYGDRVDGWIVAWGMAFEDRAAVVDVDGRGTMSLQAPHNALYYFARENYCTPRLVWVN